MTIMSFLLCVVLKKDRLKSTCIWIIQRNKNSSSIQRNFSALNVSFKVKIFTRYLYLQHLHELFSPLIVDLFQMCTSPFHLLKCPEINEIEFNNHQTCWNAKSFKEKHVSWNKALPLRGHAEFPFGNLLVHELEPCGPIQCLHQRSHDLLQGKVTSVHPRMDSWAVSMDLYI